MKISPVCYIKIPARANWDMFLVVKLSTAFLPFQINPKYEITFAKTFLPVRQSVTWLHAQRSVTWFGAVVTEPGYVKHRQAGFKNHRLCDLPCSVLWQLDYLSKHSLSKNVSCTVRFRNIIQAWLKSKNINLIFKCGPTFCTNSLVKLYMEVYSSWAPSHCYLSFSVMAMSVRTFHLLS